MIWYRNFIHTFRRFMMASVINLVGLAVAFAAFFVIMTQVQYDYDYDKGYDGYENLIRIDYDAGPDEGGRKLWMCLPLARIVTESSPHVVGSTLVQGYVTTSPLWVGEANYKDTRIVRGFYDFFSPLRPDMVVGNASDAILGGKALLPLSLATKYFGRADCVGETIIIGERDSGQRVEVGGVYRDFPKNSTFGNDIYLRFSDEMLKAEDNWMQFNYMLYLRLDDASAADEVVAAASATLKKVKDEEGEPVQENVINYTRMEDVHFSTIGGTSGANTTTLLLLVAIAIVVVVVSAINFMNFSLAETPMRIRSINTQKVLGASVASLRTTLILESVAVCLVAFLLAGGLVLVGCRFGLQDVVQADVSFAAHPYLVILTLVEAVVSGVLAGLYPAFYATSIPPAVALKGDFGLSHGGRMLRTALLGFQFVVAFALVVCIGIMYSQFRHINNAQYGLDKDAIVFGNTTFKIHGHYDAVRSELIALSCVENVSFSNFRIGVDWYMNIGRGDDEQHMAIFDCLKCDAYYLETLGIKVAEGRSFNETDNGAYIFNKAAMDRFPWFTVGKPPFHDNSWSSQNGEDVYDWPIVGVCDNIRYKSLRHANNSPMAFCVFSKSCDWGNGVINIRVAKGSDLVEVVNSLHSVLDKYNDNGQAELCFMDDHLKLLYDSERRFSSQVMLFSVIAIMLSLMGVLGLSMFEAEYRRKEIAVRKVLGCETTAVVMMFVRRYAVILGVCFALGAPLGYILCQHWLSGFAERVEISPLIFVAALLAVGCVTLCTVAAQVWRTASANPVVALKS